MDKNIGKKLDGRYEITELIGVGGMAEVYKGVDVIDNKTVAIKILKKEFGENVKVVFIGPCIAKKGETLNPYIADSADYALTYGEIVAMLDSRQILLEPVPEDYQEASVFGKRFAGTGGVADAVLEVMREMGEDVSDINLLTRAGGEACKKALM